MWSTVYYTTIESPVGGLLLAGDARALRLVSLREANIQRLRAWTGSWTRSRLRSYPAIASVLPRELKEFDLPLAMEGTEFQLRVWNALRAIPYGETISYAELAERIGNRRAVRRWDWPTGAIASPSLCRAIASSAAMAASRDLAAAFQRRRCFSS